MSDNMAIEFASLTKSALETMERKLVKLSVVEMEPSNPNLAQYADDLAAQATILLQTKNPNITPVMVPSIPNAEGKYFSGPCPAAVADALVHQGTFNIITEDRTTIRLHATYGTEKFNAGSTVTTADFMHVTQPADDLTDEGTVRTMVKNALDKLGIEMVDFKPMKGHDTGRNLQKYHVGIDITVAIQRLRNMKDYYVPHPGISNVFTTLKKLRSPRTGNHFSTFVARSATDALKICPKCLTARKIGCGCDYKGASTSSSVRAERKARAEGFMARAAKRAREANP